MWGSGFITQIIYAAAGGAVSENGALLTEDGNTLLTEDSRTILIESA